MIILTQKKCSKCGEIKDISKFSKRNDRKSGYSSQCSSCRNPVTKKWREDNPDRARELSRRWQENNRDKVRVSSLKWNERNADRVKEYQKEWYLKNKEKVLEYGKIWSNNNRDKKRAAVRRYKNKNIELNREKDRQYKRVWRSSNPELAAIIDRNKRAKRKYRTFGKITAKEWNDLKTKYNRTCLCCRKQEPEIELTLDHVKPLSIGGLNVIGNAQPLCLHCNCSKKDKEIDYRW